MQYVGWSLAAATQALREKQFAFDVVTTSPVKKSGADQGPLYVVRQREREDGSYSLVVAAKMEKEVQ
ncbi:hypothetical protein [Propionispora hippei]|uniref:Uncharacterized protein n=1 Tax=Propionispora hippei DSM 15287 TaxID=1123003 RepID=A0A1M6D6B2_9FIRM|nr:hypothetical protein [Propionispora hippei]SHI68683.1 hypothetical protein SAMN02745170_00854 [Propionispora hippei DSM 15287]